MSVLDVRIAHNLPYLRRFARSLTGSQTIGDGLVSDLIVDVYENPSRILADLNPRIALYREFLVYFRHRINTDFMPRSTDKSANFDEAMKSHCEISRIAMLLAAVEGFNTGEVCEIMQIDEMTLASILELINLQLSIKTGQKVCLIEDEPLIAMRIRELIQDMGYQVCSVSRTENQALVDLRRHNPDLIVSDVKLANGGSGFSAVRMFVETNEVPVVFVTAFPETLLTGNGPEPIFLVSKPFQPAMLRAAISQALHFRSRPFTNKAA